MDPFSNSTIMGGRVKRKKVEKKQINHNFCASWRQKRMINSCFHPGRLTWQWKTQSFEDVSPIKNGDFPARHVSFCWGAGGIQNNISPEKMKVERQSVPFEMGLFFCRVGGLKTKKQSFEDVKMYNKKQKTNITMGKQQFQDVSPLKN